MRHVRSRRSRASSHRRSRPFSRRSHSVRGRVRSARRKPGRSRRSRGHSSSRGNGLRFAARVMNVLSPLKEYNNITSGTISVNLNQCSYFLGNPLMSPQDCQYLCGATGTGGAGGNTQATNMYWQNSRTMLHRAVQVSEFYNTSTARITVSCHWCVCRKAIPYQVASPIWGSLGALFVSGFSTTYGPSDDTGMGILNGAFAQIPIGNTSTTIFQNPAFLAYFRIFKTQNYTLGPGQKRSHSLVVKRKMLHSADYGQYSNPVFLAVRGEKLLVFKVMGYPAVDSGSVTHCQTSQASAGLIHRERYSYQVVPDTASITHTMGTDLPTNVGGATYMPNQFTIGANAVGTANFFVPSYNL